MGLILVSGHNRQDFTKLLLLNTTCMVEHVTDTQLLKKFHFFVEVKGSVLFSEEPNAAISCESVPQLHTLLL
jgi:hypothetical protein